MDTADRASVESLASSLGSEKNVVERIRAELDARGWTQAELSRRMEAHAAGSTGGVLHPVVLSKLLNGDRGRHVSIDQLITLAGVFDVSVSEMLLPPESMEMAEVLRALADGPALQRSAILADGQLASAQDTIAGAMHSSDFWRGYVADALEEALTEIQRQGRTPSDSVRWAFLAGVLDRYEARRDEES